MLGSFSEMEYPGELETEKILSAWLWRDFISNFFLGIYYSIVVFLNSEVQLGQNISEVLIQNMKKGIDKEESRYRYPANFSNWSN